MGLFDVHRHPSCLRVLAAAVETFAAGASMVQYRRPLLPPPTLRHTPEGTQRSHPRAYPGASQEYTQAVRKLPDFAKCPALGEAVKRPIYTC